MRRLIVNADDLGISKEVNQQIEECIRRGCVTSTTVIANAAAFDDGVRLAKQFPQVSVGVHLNIVEFAPLTNADVFRKHGVLNSEGEFIEGAFSVVPIDDELRQAVFEEWDAQISKVESTGLKPSHCDSHQHTHTIPDLQDTLCRVLDKHHITKVRRKIIPSIRLMIHSKKHPSVKLDKSKAMQPRKRNVLYRRFYVFIAKFISYQWNRMMSNHYHLTDHFYSFRDFYSSKQLLRLGGKESVIELMCHPGHNAFQTETENLMNDKNWKDGYQLISYYDL